MGTVICVILKWENRIGFTGTEMPKGGSGKNKLNRTGIYKRTHKISIRL